MNPKEQTGETFALKSDYKSHPDFIWQLKISIFIQLGYIDVKLPLKTVIFTFFVIHTSKCIPFAVAL